MQKPILLSCLAVALTSGVAFGADPSPSPLAPVTVTALTPFSTKQVGGNLYGWQFQALRGVKNQTRYVLVKDEELGLPVVEASADGAAGGLGVRLDVEAKASPILRFKWRVGNLIESSDPRSKSGDDYSARIYVTFLSEPERASFRERTENALARTLYGETPPKAALAYVFSHKAKQGEIILSPFTSRVKKIVIDADPASVGKWKSFERNVYEDYKRAFGDEPTRISGIAIMVDTDNTGEKASARFGDVSLSSK
ncbi:MAG: DUF3047 domain-containing protein [Betaproteobacteria bacterium]|nr:MAG: DUF3047 domain-containing protein [Betaproteobacteria bacterium]